jgi:hypothetical protein
MANAETRTSKTKPIPNLFTSNSLCIANLSEHKFAKVDGIFKFFDVIHAVFCLVYTIVLQNRR